jgi:hypothetical protein
VNETDAEDRDEEMEEDDEDDEYDEEGADGEPSLGAAHTAIQSLFRRLAGAGMGGGGGAGKLFVITNET